MSIIAQRKYSLGYHHNVQPHRVASRTRFSCSATPTATKPSSFATQLTVPPLKIDTQQKIVKTSSPIIVNDSDIKSTWSHRAWLATGCTTVLVSLAKSVTGSVESHMWLEPLLAGCAGYILADLASGVYHWAIDNYGGPSTPIVGAQIEAFQGHHKWPWFITRRQVANNLHALGRAVTFSLLPLVLLVNDPVEHAFVALFSGCIMFSQQFHAWAHGTRSRLPPLVVALQEAGVLVSRSQHAAHHRPPYNNNYCIVSGAWNEFLDKHKVFEALEMMVFFKLRVRPRSWSETSSDWIEEADPDSELST